MHCLLAWAVLGWKSGKTWHKVMSDGTESKAVEEFVQNNIDKGQQQDDTTTAARAGSSLARSEDDGSNNSEQGGSVTTAELVTSAEVSSGVQHCFECVQGFVYSVDQKCVTRPIF